MAQAVAGTFTTNPAAAGIGNQFSDALVIPTGVTSMRLSTSGVNASNTVRTQRSLDNGLTWADQTTYSSEQTNTSITVAHGQQWRLAQVVQQAQRDVRYVLSVES